MKKAGMDQQKLCPSIFLVGMMGSGKTSCGKRLARILGYKFADLDAELEEKSGIQIPEIFAQEGEVGFRKRESELLKDYLNSSGFVLATGGGVVTRAANREALKSSSCVVIYLTVSPEGCFKRTLGSSRPLLQGENPQKKISELLAERSKWYEEVADIKADSEAGSPHEVALNLKKSLERLGIALTNRPKA